MCIDCPSGCFRHVLDLAPAQLSKVLDALSSAFGSEIDATVRDGLDLSDINSYRAHKQSLETYAFLLLWFVQAAEGYVRDKPEEDVGTSKGKKGAKAKTGKSASKAKGEFNWMGCIPDTLALFAKALRLKTERIWQTTSERDAFVR